MTPHETKLAEELLGLLKKHPRSFSSLASLGKDMEVAPEELRRAKETLLEWGYKIKSDRKKGFSLAQVPDLLLDVEIKDGLETKILGRQVHSYQAIGSTNRVAFSLAEAGAPEGTIVVAEKQTAGQGRLSRKWFSPPGVGIWLSVILRPQIPIASVAGLSLATCLACVRTVERLCLLQPVIKWPNDSYLKGKKFAGVLTELSAELDKVNFVVVGIGINLNQVRKDFPAPLRPIATSLSIESGRKIPRVLFLQTFLKELETIYQDYQETGLKKFKPEIMDRFLLLNREATIRVGENLIRGKAVDLDPLGALILETKTGRKVVTAGDVALV